MWLCQKCVVISIFLYFRYSVGNVLPRVEINTRIVGGDEIDIKDRYYQVSILYGGQHFCGGALITPDTVLSAGHCFGESYSSMSTFFQVRVGSNKTGTNGQVLQIKSVLVHQNYSAESIDFDISLVKLRANATLSNTVGLIKISNQDNYPYGSYASVSGWGYQDENGTLAPTLRYAMVPIAKRSNCESAYSTLIKITKNMICAGYPEGGKDACQGDSGGPLVQNNKLIGLVSFGMGCARKSYPGVYTNVARLVNWVVNNSNYIQSDNGGYNGVRKQVDNNIIMIIFVIFSVTALNRLR